MEEQIKTLFKNQQEIKDLTETVHKLATALDKQGMSLRSTEEKVGGRNDEQNDKPNSGVI